MSNQSASHIARLVAGLSPDQIRVRLLELDREGRALRVLLRAALARDRRRLDRKEVARAR